MKSPHRLRATVAGQHHLIVAHEVVKTGSDREQLASIAGNAKDATGVEALGRRPSSTLPNVKTEISLDIRLQYETGDGSARSEAADEAITTSKRSALRLNAPRAPQQPKAFLHGLSQRRTVPEIHSLGGIRSGGVA